MASNKEQMLRARELIKAKKYDEARAILKKINHPTAKEWLDKLDNMSAAPKSGKAKTTSSTTSSKKPAGKVTESTGTSRRGLLLRLAVLILIIVLAVVAYAAFNSNGDKDEAEGATSTEAANEATEIPAEMEGTAESQAESLTAEAREGDESATEEPDGPGLPPGLGTNNENSGPFPPGGETGNETSSLPPFAQTGNGETSNNGLPPFGNIGGPPVGGSITVNNPLGGTITLEAPEGWSQQIPGLGALSHIDYGDSILLIAAPPAAVAIQGLSLEEIARALNANQQQVEFTTHTVNGRDILETVITADDGRESDVFYVESNGNVAILTIVPGTEVSDALRDDVLEMASTVTME